MPSFALSFVEVLAMYKLLKKRKNPEQDLLPEASYGTGLTGAAAGYGAKPQGTVPIKINTIRMINRAPASPLGP
jgi:hypothetical protein